MSRRQRRWLRDHGYRYSYGARRWVRADRKICREEQIRWHTLLSDRVQVLTDEQMRDIVGSVAR